jgi:hypothetical protein
MQPMAVATERRQVFITGLDAARVGSTDTSVLRFGAAVVFQGLPAAQWLTVTTTAANGTTLRFLRRGVYQVALVLTTPASGTIAGGISFAAGPTTLLAANPPINTQAGVLSGMTAIAPVSTAISITPTVIVPISDAEAGNVDPNQATVRAHATKAAGNALEAGDVIAAQARLTVTYLGDFQGA